MGACLKVRYLRNHEYGVATRPEEVLDVLDHELRGRIVAVDRERSERLAGYCSHDFALPQHMNDLGRSATVTLFPRQNEAHAIVTGNSDLMR